MKKRRVLFLCTGNSARSQMAEGFARKLFADRWEAYSAGTQPASYVHPLAVQVMAELGVDISGHRPKSVNEFRDMELDLVVTVCDNAAHNCPAWLGRGQIVHVGFPDPAAVKGNLGEQLEAFRRVRDAILLDLVDHLDELAKPAEVKLYVAPSL